MSTKTQQTTGVTTGQTTRVGGGGGGGGVVGGRVSIRQNLSDESVDQINQLINLFWQADYVCHSMAYYFDRAEVGLYGLAVFNRKCAFNNFRLAQKLMDYLVVRGGRVVLDDIDKPDTLEWGQPVESLQSLLNVKKSLYDAALKVHTTAEKAQDPHLTDFIEEEYIRPLSLSIRRLGVLISNLQTAGQGLGVYQFNKHIVKNTEVFFEYNKEITQYLRWTQSINSFSTNNYFYISSVYNWSKN